MPAMVKCASIGRAVGPRSSLLHLESGQLQNASCPQLQLRSCPNLMPPSHGQLSNFLICPFALPDEVNWCGKFLTIRTFLVLVAIPMCYQGCLMPRLQGDCGFPSCVLLQLVAESPVNVSHHIFTEGVASDDLPPLSQCSFLQDLFNLKPRHTELNDECWPRRVPWSNP